MKGKRLLLYSAIRSTGLLKLAQITGLSEAAGWDQQLLVFAYHRIGSGPETAFDDQVFSASAELFRNQMKWLRENAEPLSEDDLLEISRTRRKPPRRATLVTFDDGYRDNYTVALPILREFRIPAIYFIPTLSIESRELGWWDLIAYAVKKASPTGDPDQVRDQVSDQINKMIRDRQREYTSLSVEVTGNYLERLFNDLGVQRPPIPTQSHELMSWEEIGECQRAGISIGSHTHSHEVLSRLPLSGQQQEFLESRRILKERLGVSVRSVAYPVGGYEHFNRETLELARQCGFELGFSFGTGKNGVELNPLDVRRHTPPSGLEEMSGLFEFPDLLAPRRCLMAEPLPASE